ncbi:MAG: hypothetical protein EAX86_09635 [Candidatus Heimdallarchaeota archaeon]|nr:hypothetical protein [Candidatus Heimdallarchaeota archaeon]
MKNWYKIIPILVFGINIIGILVINSENNMLYEINHPSRLAHSYFSSSIKVSTNPSSRNSVSHPLLSVTENTTSILDITGIKDNFQVAFEPNIWADQLGSSSQALISPSLYQNGLIVTTEPEELNNSLFVRIGNSGYGDTLNTALDTKLLDGLSAGWRIEFPVIEDFDLIHIAFKWRYNAEDGVFDDYVEVKPGVVTDSTPDFQEVRARISAPNESNSFWLNTPSTTDNPNGTVYYRMGSVVTQDEEWMTFSYNFSVAPSATNYTLELGAFLNTREFYNEYFDVWFDDIEIIGVNNALDDIPPIPVTMGLDRTLNVSEFTFWTEFAEGSWMSSIKNVSVYYNRTGLLSNASVNDSLIFQPPYILDNAGYNHTVWQYTDIFEFGDNVSYYFLIFDLSDNSYQTPIDWVIIGDFEAPRIIGIFNPLDKSFLRQFGNGTISISLQAYDWGNATESVELHYMIGEELKDPIEMLFNGTYYTIRLTIPYGQMLRFNITLSDTASNYRSYNFYSISVTEDKVAPTINDFSIEASHIEEGRTFVNVSASDSFGEIKAVNVVIKNPDDTLVKNLTLRYDSTNDLYVLGTVLRLPYNPEINYTFTAYVKDEAGLIVNSSINYVVPDIVAPTVEISEVVYTTPGLMVVWVYATDGGSGIASVTLEKKFGSSWLEEGNLNYSHKRQLYYYEIQTDFLGNQLVEIRIKATDMVNNVLSESNRPYLPYYTRYFFTTGVGLLITESLIILIVITFFGAIKVAQRRRVRRVREKRFVLALDRSERLAYLGQEAMFGFVAAFGRREGSSSVLMWEPRLIGNFYQFFKELADKANNAVDFVMQTKPHDIVTFVDFKIEEIGCTAITFAYPISTLPQQYLSALTLDQAPLGAGQGVLILMLLMREKWGDVSLDFQAEITDVMRELKNLILAGEAKDIVLQKSREHRLFISGTVEVLEEIETDIDEISEDIMGDFGSELLDS